MAEDDFEDRLAKANDRAEQLHDDAEIKILTDGTKAFLEVIKELTGWTGDDLTLIAYFCAETVAFNMGHVMVAQEGVRHPCQSPIGGTGYGLSPAHAPASAPPLLEYLERAFGNLRLTREGIEQMLALVPEVDDPGRLLAILLQRPPALEGLTILEWLREDRPFEPVAEWLQSLRDWHAKGLQFGIDLPFSALRFSPSTA